MRSKGFDGMVCPIAGVMAAIGDRWGLLILRDLVCGLSRYDEFRQSSGITNATLSDRLKHLEANGLVERRRYQVNPERFEYLLTHKGWQIAPVMPVLAQIGDSLDVSGASAPPMKFVNRKTGARCGGALSIRRRGSGPTRRIWRSRKVPAQTSWSAGACRTVTGVAEKQIRQADERLLDGRPGFSVELHQVLPGHLVRQHAAPAIVGDPGEQRIPGPRRVFRLISSTSRDAYQRRPACRR
ncbi:putative HTH-type transcriptional regulator [Burkholderia cepacia]|nr:putative HTH-type transcriptional regulator [Burkholderia cepacia]